MGRGTWAAGCAPPSRMADRRRRSRRLVVALVAIVGAAVAAGCDATPGLLDAPYPVNLHVAATTQAVEVDAPGWYADQTDIFLCPSEPPYLPDPGPDRQDWSPGPPCHAFGRFESPDGMQVSLPLDALDERDRAAFAAAESWYLLLVDVGATGQATGATRSRFGVPDGFAAS